LRLRVDADELAHPQGRVVVFTVPARPIGMPIDVDGAYWMRSGESLVRMTPDRLKRIFDEAAPDYSATICAAASIGDLAPEAVARFRRLWEQRQPAPRVRSDARLLEDAELLRDGKVTVAALVLLGTQRALGRHLAASEIVFEYRSDETAIRSEQRVELRNAFLLIDDEVWRLVELRNTVHQLVRGLFRSDIPSINPQGFREAVLNAVCHRDYRLSGSIFVKQWPSKVEITSPGGFPEGITADNILFRQAPRNRRLAEAFGRCGLVERSGQGADLLFETAVREGKVPLDFTGTDDYQVRLTLHGRIVDEGFVRFLAQAADDAGRTLGLEDLLILNAIKREQPIPKGVSPKVGALIDLGLIERAGRGTYVLSRKYHRVMGLPGAYTRKKGLDRETNKALLIKHLRENPGSQLAELCGVLPSLSRDQVQTLLRQLKSAQRIHSTGIRRSGRWFLGADDAIERNR
jgi:ATP-dependent DNA helicase RecG